MHLARWNKAKNPNIFDSDVLRSPTFAYLIAEYMIGAWPDHVHQEAIDIRRWITFRQRERNTKYINKLNISSRQLTRFLLRVFGSL